MSAADAHNELVAKVAVLEERTATMSRAIGIVEELSEELEAKVKEGWNGHPSLIFTAARTEYLVKWILAAIGTIAIAAATQFVLDLTRAPTAKTVSVRLVQALCAAGKLSKKDCE